MNSNVIGIRFEILMTLSKHRKNGNPAASKLFILRRFSSHYVEFSVVAFVTC